MRKRAVGAEHDGERDGAALAHVARVDAVVLAILRAARVEDALTFHRLAPLVGHAAPPKLSCSPPRFAASTQDACAARPSGRRSAIAFAPPAARTGAHPCTSMNVPGRESSTGRPQKAQLKTAMTASPTQASTQ